MPGKLLIVGTPLGNLSDFPPRAIEALKSADTILCEDTRHSRKLLTHFGIDTPAESHHEHNEDEKTEALIQRMIGGETLAIISDAGMPLISDPGFPIVRRAREAGITVEPIPGPVAAILALVASGLPPLPFTFLGFSPHRQGERRDFYLTAAELGHTVVFYESPERLVGSLEDALEVFGESQIAVARELTKLHEEIVSGTIASVLDSFKSRDLVRGEITVVLGARAKEQVTVSNDTVLEEFTRLRESGMRRNDAVKAVAEKFGMRKNDVYKMLITSSE